MGVFGADARCCAVVGRALINLRKADYNDTPLIVSIRSTAILAHPKTFWSADDSIKAAAYVTKEKIISEMPDFKFYVYDQKAFIGFKSSFLSYLFLMPELQGKGLGTKLLRFCEEEISNYGNKEIYLWANPYAEGFYLKNGYRKTKEQTAPFDLPVTKFIKNLV